MAWPERRDLTVRDDGAVLHSHEGYAVVYEGGYQSWAPKETFEAAYQPETRMDFGRAMQAMREGRPVCRLSWNPTFERPIYIDRDCDAIVRNCYTDPGAFDLWTPTMADLLAFDWAVYRGENAQDEAPADEEPQDEQPEPSVSFEAAMEAMKKGAHVRLPSWPEGEAIKLNRTHTDLISTTTGDPADFGLGIIFTSGWEIARKGADLSTEAINRAIRAADITTRDLHLDRLTSPHIGDAIAYAMGVPRRYMGVDLAREEPEVKEESVDARSKDEGEDQDAPSLRRVVLTLPAAHPTHKPFELVLDVTHWNFLDGILTLYDDSGQLMSFAPGEWRAVRLDDEEDAA